jgi:hypothetical protein
MDLFVVITVYLVIKHPPGLPDIGHSILYTGACGLVLEPAILRLGEDVPC